jgi:arginine utilization protein RocB
VADQSLTGKEEKVIRAVERTLRAAQASQQPGVKITNLSSGKIQIEVHAYNDLVEAAADQAMLEYERVMAWALAQQGLVAVPDAELQRLRWYASIGQAHEAKQEPAPDVAADPSDLLHKLSAINAGVEITDAD